jgi:hypothetical protein
MYLCMYEHINAFTVMIYLIRNVIVLVEEKLPITYIISIDIVMPYIISIDI